MIDVVLELDADLPLVRLVSDERMFQELIGGGPLGIILHQTVLDEIDELLRPVDGKMSLHNINISHQIKGEVVCLFV